jgi:CubicO group peptidase (beta-lactamase class C family)
VKVDEKAIEEIAGEYFSSKTPGMALLIGQRGEVVYKKGFGMADIEKGIPIDADTAFIIASITKQFTAMAVMMLKEKGLLDYDDAIGRFFPDFPPYKEKVTIRHLLTHTSGIKEYFDQDFIKTAGEMGEALTQEYILERIKNFGGLEFEPDTKFSYSNSGYVMLGAIIEQVSEKTFAEFLKENIFEPLNMERTVVGTSSKLNIEKMAWGYSKDERECYRKTLLDMAALGWTDGNIISTVEDLFKWHNALYTEKLVKKETLKEAFTPHVLRDGTSTGYGFGWFIGERAGVKEIWHSGGTIGYVSRFSRFVDEGVAVIMLTNCYDLAGPKRDELFDRIVNVVFAGLGRKIL